MVLFICLYLTAIAIVLVREIFLEWRCRRIEKYSRQSERLMALVREMIDMAYLYEDSPEKFYRKFLEKISAASLSARGIINPDALLHDPQYNRGCKGLRREDAELWTLVMAGFSTRELMVIYGLTNINSVYVKLHRLRGRLGKEMRQLIEDN